MAAEGDWLESLWDPVRNRGEPRLLFIVRPGPSVRDVITKTMAEHRVAERFAGNPFAPENWHQSVSDRYLDTQEIRAALLRAGNIVRASAFTLMLDRIHAAKNARGSFNWDLRCKRRPQELTDLVGAINTAISAEGLPQGKGHSPHVTLCYSATSALLRDEPITPIEWTIDSIELVLGGGRPYGYTTLDQWSLAPEAPRAIQSSMF